MTLTAARLRRLLRIWPPYVGAGVRVREFADDGSRAVVTYRVGMLTKNGVGTAFGGTLSAMTDPFYMLLSMVRLGSRYQVWDTRGEIAFTKPGRGTLTAVMEIDDETYTEIEEACADGDKHLRWFECDIVDAEGDVVAHVRRQVYFRLKKNHR